MCVYKKYTPPCVQYRGKKDENGPTYVFWVLIENEESVAMKKDKTFEYMYTPRETSTDYAEINPWVSKLGHLAGINHPWF